ncbi:hypothetical protein L917_07606 [Phytophthora nicotianae]|uniref:Uncharacterized protein n=1 Tax=Phytophthora nicotianae TaxID=4792 RepID=W2LCE7_PHYNI|nr:hypothetical protein L917_07606 [Phytophthora nicotianae]
MIAKISVVFKLIVPWARTSSSGCLKEGYLRRALRQTRPLHSLAYHLARLNYSSAAGLP